MAEIEELDRPEALSRRIERQAYDRLIALSDGVFAFAATLLALDVHIPDRWDGRLATLITTDSVSKLIGYVTSFMVVAIYWMGNRRVIAQFARVDGVASFLCIVVLLLVALLPSVSQTLVIQGRMTEAAPLYVGYVTVIGWVQGGLWAYGAFAAKLTHPGVDLRQKVVSLVWMLMVPTLASGLAIWSVQAGQAFGAWSYFGVPAVVGSMMVARHFVFRRRS